MTKKLFVFVLGFYIFQAYSQTITRQQYIERYKDIAIEEMKKTGIPASITLAQGMLESGNGNSKLAKEANNHFGIKCHSDWNGKKFYQDDDAKDECFRVYKNPEESFIDHSDFLVNRSRYAFLFELKPTDYKAWAKGLKEAGYATNPKYPELLIKIIEDNNLQQYDVHSKKTKDEISKNVVSETIEKANKPGKTWGNPYYESVEVKLHENNIKYYLANEGESYQNIANKFNMRLWQILKYNELPKTVTVTKANEVVYLQPKRYKAKTKTYIVKQGDTWHGISQMFGIKTKAIFKKNGLSADAVPEPGVKIRLR